MLEALRRRSRPGKRGLSARAVLAIALALPFLSLSSCAIEREAVLVVRDGTGRKLAVVDLPDRRFSHVFKHSFHLTPVEERMEVEKDGTLHLYELRYESCGVGMPTEAEEGFRLEEGVFVLSMSRTFKEMPVMVSPLPGHGIVAGGIFHPFTDWTQVGRQLILKGGARFRIHISGR